MVKRIIITIIIKINMAINKVIVIIKIIVIIGIIHFIHF